MGKAHILGAKLHFSPIKPIKSLKKPKKLHLGNIICMDLLEKLTKIMSFCDS